MEQRLDARTTGLIAFTLIIWSSAFAGIRAGLEAYAPAHVALLRFITASVVLAIYALITRMPLPKARDLPAIALLGFIGITVYHVALVYGEVTVTAGAASLIIAAAPMFSALLALFFLNERLKVWGWVGIAISFFGVLLITLGQEEGGLQFDPNALLVLLSAISTSLFFVFEKPYLEKYSALQFTTYTMWAGTLFMLVFLPGLPQAVMTAPLNTTLAIVYLGVFPAALGYIIWTYALSKAPASQVVSFLYLNPVLAIIIAWFWIQEVPETLSLVGGAIALAGVIIINRWGKVKVTDTAQPAEELA